MKVALVHDWLTGMRGGERCLEEIADLLDNPALYTIFYEPRGVSEKLRALNPRVSFLGRLPGVKRYYRHLLPFYPAAARNLERTIRRDTAGSCELLVSVSHCAVKNVRAPEGAKHLCYCLTPVRYFWDQYERYFATNPLEPAIRRVVERLRHWDIEGAAEVTHFVAISEFVKQRIRRVYGRDADVIYPPVRTDWLRPLTEFKPGEGFLVVNALVPYKNTEYIVRSFNRLNLPLTIVGSGPESGRLRKIANQNIRFIEWVTNSELAELYRKSKALVFAAEEDFGMTPVEMMASGRPVIALGRGGVLETVADKTEGKTGLFFSELSDDSICDAIHSFLDRESEFTIKSCIERARLFSVERFQEQFCGLVSRLGLATVLHGRPQFPAAPPLRASC